MQQIVFAVGLFSWFFPQFIPKIFLRIIPRIYRHIFPSCFLIPLHEANIMSYAPSQGSKEVDEDVTSDAALIPPVDESALTRRFCSLKISLVCFDWLYFSRNIYLVDSFQRRILLIPCFTITKTFRHLLSPEGVTECLALEAVRPAGTFACPVLILFLYYQNALCYVEKLYIILPSVSGYKTF